MDVGFEETPVKSRKVTPVPAGAGAAVPDTLASAFENFARASASLETSWEALRRRVEELSTRLRETENRLQASLDENVRLQETAARRSRLEAMGRMAAEIAHEIRNPLGSLELTASLLRDDLEGDPRRDLAFSVLEGIRTLTRVTGNLLTFTRSVAPRMQELEVDACLRRTGELAAPACAARGIALCVDPAPPLAFRADPELFQQILLNVVQNALEATSPGRRVRLSAAGTGEAVEFRVEDTGCGMDAETLARVFDPFFTTRARGTGLGLSISHRLAEAQGARIEVASAPGRGTTVTVCFPAGTTGGTVPGGPA